MRSADRYSSAEGLDSTKLFVLAMEFFPVVDRCEHKISVALAVGSHPFPFRTRKLSLPAPMVLGWNRPGRVGRRRISLTRGPSNGGPLVTFSPVLGGEVRLRWTAYV